LSKFNVRGAHYLSVLALSIMLIGLLVPPAAAREYSIWEWWTDQAFLTDEITPVSPPWGSGHSTDTAADIWNNYMVDMPTWTVPLADPYPKISGNSVLHIEYAGFATSNVFGWYAKSDPGTLNPIFVGADGSGASVEVDFTALQGDDIAFYLTNGEVPTQTWHSDPADNIGVLGDAGLKHVRVFENPDEDESWILAWEDRAMYTPRYDYDAAWADSSALTWYAPTEPDYNDMILSFKWETKGDKGTPELSTILLLGLSLVAVPVVRRRRRS